ncbi:Down syndrome cell adhesion molecule homolog [Diachasma alloeum]|uniref:Down syndrome cell adhesion molecule homolog n=1 Tax=Diachasma alloeum TaxID=454923 RepID=UPI0007383B1F|nr:Down syndrome cell adhesion molecule homolog [Diachasma alloeum]
MENIKQKECSGVKQQVVLLYKLYLPIIYGRTPQPRRAVNVMGGMEPFVQRSGYYYGLGEPARFESPSKNVTIRRGDSVTLDCTVIGDNPIEVKWMHNNDYLDTNSHRLSIAQVKAETGLKSQLSIGSSDRQDSGTYRCTADNAYGRSEHLMYLAVQERPDPPTTLQVIEIGSRSIRLSWKRSFDGNSPIRNYIIQYRTLGHALTDEWDPSKTHNITFTPGNLTAAPTNLAQNALSRYETTSDDQEIALVGGLHPAVTYTFRIFAINSIDISEPTDPVVAKTQEEAPTEPPQNVKVESAGPGELIVHWQAPPKESCNGDLLGYIVTWSEHSSSTSGVNQSKSLTVNGWATTKVQLTGLRKFTKYDISIRAFNSIASGPGNPSIVGTTQEGGGARQRESSRSILGKHFPMSSRGQLEPAGGMQLLA